MYIHRHAESTAAQLAKMFGAVLVTGPRQAGKTALLKKAASEIPCVTLGDPLTLLRAREESGTFFKDNPPPVLVDEIQKSPELFPQIKRILDQNRKKGQFLLCSPLQFQRMRTAGESLAGRLGFLTLLGLSLREICGVGLDLPVLPTDSYFSERGKHLEAVSSDEVWEAIHRGSMPELWETPEAADWQVFYATYVRTYIERDVRDLAAVGDTVRFTKFMCAAAASTGQLLNLSSLARAADISLSTARRWLSILVSSNLVYLLPPYFNSCGNSNSNSNSNSEQAVRTPKLYFLDTGLAAYLTKWPTAEVLKYGAMAGAFFETFVVSEILKSCCNRGILDPPLSFCRDKDGNEIDLLMEDGGILYPVQIRRHTDPNAQDIDSFAALDRIPGVQRGPGGVVCLGDNLASLRGKDRAIPVCYL